MAGEAYSDKLPNKAQMEQLIDAISEQNKILSVSAGVPTEQVFEDYKTIQRVVQAGNASKTFSIGDQINTVWTDKTTGKTYDMPFDIVNFQDVTMTDGETRPGMIIQSHYAMLNGVQFGNAEAIYAASKAALPAGTYHFKLGNNWGSNAVKDKVYQFTLTKSVPQGGQIRGLVQMPDKAASSWTVSTYESNTSNAPIETVKVTEGSAGTDMGTMQYDGAPSTTAAYPLNCMQRVAYGNNRWQNSAMEQYLNSKDGKGAWWKPRDDYDVPPDQLASLPGFMAGFSDDFLSILKPIKIDTAKNTTAFDGTTDTTYDVFFPPSLEQMYITPQAASGTEGTAWQYWKERLGRTSPAQQWQTYKELIAYALESHTSAQDVRLRSARRGYACYAWGVDSSGYVYGHYGAWHAWRCAPACAIC